MKRILSIILALSFLLSCTDDTSSLENDKYSGTQSEVKKEEVPEELSVSQKEYISSRIEEYESIKKELDKVNFSNGAKIAELNRKINNLESFPDWFDKSIKEVRYIRLIKSFITEIGTAKATRNKESLKLGNKDFKETTTELKAMLK